MDPALIPTDPTLAETFASQVQPVLVTTLVGVAIALAGLVAYAIKVLVGRAKLWLDSLSTDARWRAANAKLELAAVAGVEAAEQTLARQLRAVEPYGRLDPMQGQAVLRAAVEAARSHFGPAVWSEIGTTMQKSATDLAELLRHKIEAAVFRSKSPAVAVLEVPAVVGEPMTVGPDDSTVRTSIDGLEVGDSGVRS